MSKKDRKTVNKKCICCYEGCWYISVKECPIHGDIVGRWEQGKNYWEEKFEDKIQSYKEKVKNHFIMEDGKRKSYIYHKTGFYSVIFADWLYKYFSHNDKIKIKARKGKIVIERID